MKKLLLGLLVITCLYACKKEDDSPATSTNTGTTTPTNNNNNNTSSTKNITIITKVTCPSPGGLTLAPSSRFRLFETSSDRDNDAYFIDQYTNGVAETICNNLSFKRYYYTCYFKVPCSGTGAITVDGSFLVDANLNKVTVNGYK